MNGAQQSLLIALEFRRDGARRDRRAASAPRSSDDGEAADTAITADRRPDAGLPRLRRASTRARRRRSSSRRSTTATSAARRIAQLAVPARHRVAAAERTSPTSSTSSSPAAAAGKTRQPTGARPARHRPRRASASATPTLQPGAPNRLTDQPDTAFVVRFTNQGENDEFDVKVTLTIEGGAQADQGRSHGRHSSPKGQTATADARARPAPPHRRAGDDHGRGRAGPGREEDRQQQGRVPRRSSR